LYFFYHKTHEKSQQFYLLALTFKTADFYSRSGRPTFMQGVILFARCILYFQVAVNFRVSDTRHQTIDTIHL